MFMGCFDIDDKWCPCDECPLADDCPDAYGGRIAS